MLNSAYIQLEKLRSEALFFPIGRPEGILIEKREGVWMPKDPTLKFISVLLDNKFRDAIEGKKILEIGCGTGIIGIVLLANGASHVAMTDINQDALQTSHNNLLINNFNDATRYNLIDSDRFMGVIETYDTIISNPPVQPSIPEAHINDKALKSNENGDGRMVLNSIIKYSRLYLNPYGETFVLCSTRNGRLETKTQMNYYWGEGNWHEIQEIEYTVDPVYHGPYMNYWIRQQLEDGDLRVYLKNNNGEKYTIDQYDPTLTWFHSSYIIRAVNNPDYKI